MESFTQKLRVKRNGFLQLSAVRRRAKTAGVEKRLGPRIRRHGRPQDLSSRRPDPLDRLAQQLDAQQAKAALPPAPEASGPLRVAIADSLCSALMPPLLARFHALCPRVEVSLRTATTQEMQDLLSANQADLAYTFDQPVPHPSFVRLLDEPEPCCFLAPAGHPLAGRQGLTLADLAGQEFLLTERGMSYREALEHLLAARRLSLRPYLELGDAALICRLVEQGLGLTFLPRYMVEASLTGQAVPLDVADCRIEMCRQLFCHKDKWITPQMEAFIHLAQS